MLISTKKFNKLMESNPSWEFWTRFENPHTIYIRISDIETEEHVYNIVIEDSLCSLEDSNDKTILTSDFTEIENLLCDNRTKLKEKLKEAVNNEEYITAVAIATILRDDY